MNNDSKISRDSYTLLEKWLSLQSTPYLLKESINSLVIEDGKESAKQPGIVDPNFCILPKVLTLVK
jgi:hypothetical protein